MRTVYPMAIALVAASITSQVKESLLAHCSTNTLYTHVNTVSGVVTLSGKAANAAEKNLATQLASDVTGVKSVVNEMIVPAILSKH